MSQSSITCEQAIFTSVRAPMGEGYRIIAASGGLRPEEKQAITRNSPSHGSLCGEVDQSIAGSEGLGDGPQPFAVSFYPLPTERLCVAVSCPAGAEHTGRGGQRVYTHVAVLEREDFARSGFNPFRVVEAMMRSGCTTPQLKPPSKLPELRLEIDANSATGVVPRVAEVDQVVRRRLLEGLLEQRPFVIHVDELWCEAAHGLLLGIPGPLRAKIAFSTGLRFSLGRQHHLQMLRDDQGQAKTRSSGQRAEYLNASLSSDPPRDEDRERPAHKPAWVELVQKHWEQGDLAGLDRRASRDYLDITPAGRERLGRIFLTIDELESYDVSRVLATAGEYVDRTAQGAESTIHEELLSLAQSTCLIRFRDLSWPQAVTEWRALTDLWRRSERGTRFSQVVVEAFIRRLCKSDWLGAAEAAVDITGSVPNIVNAQQHRELMNEAVHAFTDGLERWAGALGRGEPVTDDRVERAERACDRWAELAGSSELLSRCQIAIERIWAECPERGRSSGPTPSAPRSSCSQTEPKPAKPTEETAAPPSRPSPPKGPLLPRRMSVSGTRPIRR